MAAMNDPNATRSLRAPRRIMIRAANWVGDAIMSTPAVRGIRRSNPGARITLLAKPWVIPVFRENPHIDEIMVYDAGGRHAGWRGRLRLARDLRRQSFDTAVLLQNAFEAALLAWMGAVPRRIGYATDGRALLLTDRIWNYPVYKKRHLIDYYLGILEESGMLTDGRHLDLFLTEKEIFDARAGIAQLGAGGKRPLIGINPGATGGNAKRWPPDRFAALARRLRQDIGADIIIFGGPEDAVLGRWMASEIGAPVIDACGKTTLREAMGMIAACQLFVTNDSGLMHVAAAVDTPQVAIIGSTNASATGPSNRRSVIVSGAGACAMAPCLKPECPIDHRCMRAVSVDMVLDKIRRLMGDHGGGAR